MKKNSKKKNLLRLRCARTCVFVRVFSFFPRDNSKNFNNLNSPLDRTNANAASLVRLLNDT